MWRVWHGAKEVYVYTLTLVQRYVDYGPGMCPLVLLMWTPIYTYIHTGCVNNNMPPSIDGLRLCAYIMCILVYPVSCM